MAERRRRKPLMSPEERAAYWREVDERTEWLEEFLARRMRRTAELMAQQERDEERRRNSLIGRLRRRLAAWTDRNPRCLAEARHRAVRPRRCSVAHLASSCRVESCSLRNTFETWLSTVFTERWSRAAISLYT